MSHGIDRIAARLMELKAYLLRQLLPLGFEILGPQEGPAAHSTTTFWHPRTDAGRLFSALEEAGVVASLRHDREGRQYLRFSPHFYNTEAEIDAVVAVLSSGLTST